VVDWEGVRAVAKSKLRIGVEASAGELVAKTSWSLDSGPSQHDSGILSTDFATTLGRRRGGAA
jgi:hypothetical protein